MFAEHRPQKPIDLYLLACYNQHMTNTGADQLVTNVTASLL
jgi:hypothetical protein